MSERDEQNNEVREEIAEETAETAVETGTKEEKSDSGRSLFEWADSLVPSVIGVILFFVFFVRLIGVSGSSMLPTLQDRDYLIVSNLFYEPKVGDIVVITKEGFLVNKYGREDSFVKRIVATEGQSVYIDYDIGCVYVDGEKQDDSFTLTPTTREGDYEFPEGGLIVPEGCVFVLGDNRNGSTDSRYSYVGMIDERCIVGHVLLRIFPVNHFGAVS